jgi:hypothetical protein
MTMSSTVDASLHELTRGMLRKTLYVLLWKGAGRDLKEQLAAHLRYMIELEQQNKLFAIQPIRLICQNRNGGVMPMQWRHDTTL